MEVLKHRFASTFQELMGYLPKCMILAKGQLAWTMKLREDANKLLAQHWFCGSQALFLKNQHLDFDAQIKKLEVTIVQVCLLGFPLIFWLDDVFWEIGNKIKHFFEADNLFKDTGYMGMAQILVGLNVTKGLKDSIKISQGDSNIK